MIAKLTGKNTKDLVQSEEITRPGILMAKPLPTEWTDEKHRLYLRSMEASFVKQLNNLEFSTNLLDWNSRGRNNLDTNSSKQLNANTCSSSSQFKVLRGGSWKKVNFERAQPLMHIADETHALPKIQWIQHFTAGGKRREVVSPSFQENYELCNEAVQYLREQKMELCVVTTSSKQFSASHPYLYHQDSIGSNTEVSDQNFDNEDYEKEQTSNNMCKPKRLKTAVPNDLTKDQVVPNEMSLDTDEKRDSPETQAGVISDRQS